MERLNKIKRNEMRRYLKDKGVDYAKRLREAQYIQYLRHELQTCTTHGLSYIANPQLPCLERIFWLVCFAGCVIMIFVLLTPLYTRLKDSPTVMSVEMDYFNWNVSYPAVSLCPRHKPDPDALEALTESYRRKTGQNLSTFLWTISSVSLDNIDIIDNQNNNIVRQIPATDYAVIAAAAFKIYHNSSISSSTEWPISVEPAMTEMGMCHVVNSNVALFDNPLTWRSGMLSQYTRSSIDLTIHDGDFHSLIANYADVYKVYIHSPDEVPLTSTPSVQHNQEGYLSLGVRVWITSISDLLRKTTLKTRKCRLLDEPISPRYPVYTYNHCMLECRIRTIQRLCGCIPHFYKPLPNETICTLPELRCVIHYKKEISTLSSNPVSMRKLESLSETFRPSEQCGCISACGSDVYQIDYEDFSPFTNTRLRVYITSFPKVRVVRHIIFGMYDLLLRSGGVVNLCIGSSIISLMELLLIGLRLPMRRCRIVTQETLKRIYDGIINNRSA